MKAYVYTDASLERYAGRFVWLAINTEDAKNAAFLKQYPIPALPTMLVLDAKRDTVALRYVGGATVAQIRHLLDDPRRLPSRATSAADKVLGRADHLASAGKQKEAATAYDRPSHAAPRRGRASAAPRVADLRVLDSGNDERCAVRALALYPRVKGTSSAPNVGVDRTLVRGVSRREAREAYRAADQARQSDAGDRSRTRRSSSRTTTAPASTSPSSKPRRLGRRRGSGAPEGRVVVVPRRRGRTGKDAGPARPCTTPIA